MIRSSKSKGISFHITDTSPASVHWGRPSHSDEQLGWLSLLRVPFPTNDENFGLDPSSG